MNIRTYMAKHGLSQQKFADRLGVTQGLVWQWLNGRTSITADKAKEIEDKTGGEVTRFECLYPDEPSPKAKRREQRAA